MKLRIEHTPRYAGRQSPETSDDFRLADGRPLWYAFLNDPNALVMAATDANRARGELRDLFRIEPDIVRQLTDGSLEEAHKVLRLTTEFSGSVDGAGFCRREREPWQPHATFHDAGRKAGISTKPDIAGLLSMLVYEFTP